MLACSRLLMLVLLTVPLVAADKAPVQDGTIEHPHITSFDQIKADYAANEIAADAKYKGKFVTMADRVVKIEKTFLGYPKLVLTASGDAGLKMTQCTFVKEDGQFKALSALNAKDSVQVLGVFKSVTLGSVFIEEARFIRKLDAPK